jgi:hypothetical protein
MVVSRDKRQPTNIYIHQSTYLMIIIFKFIVLMESENYEKHTETITIPSALVALRCDNRLPIWE